MARRAAKEAKEQGGPQIAPARPNVPLKKFIKIGRPGYKVTKQRDPSTGQQSLLFQVRYQGVEDRSKDSTKIHFNKFSGGLSRNR